jgi:hypothetical protein
MLKTWVSLILIELAKHTSILSRTRGLFVCAQLATGAMLCADILESHKPPPSFLQASPNLGNIGERRSHRLCYRLADTLLISK